MGNYQTVFGAIDNFEKGSVDIINDDPKNYAFSNVFDVASKSAPYERICVAKNFEYVIECARAEGVSDWYEHAHDEFVVNLDDRPVVVELVKQASMAHIDPDQEGASKITGSPEGQKMGTITLRRGHMALLPEDTAYRISSEQPATLIIQTIEGAETLHRWSDICEK